MNCLSIYANAGATQEIVDPINTVARAQLLASLQVSRGELGYHYEIPTALGATMTLFTRFLKDESGATAIEYALIAAIIAVMLIASLGLVRDELIALYGRITAALKTA